MCKKERERKRKRKRKKEERDKKEKSELCKNKLKVDALFIFLVDRLRVVGLSTFIHTAPLSFEKTVKVL
jgi:hypothetical protein